MNKHKLYNTIISAVITMLVMTAFVFFVCFVVIPNIIENNQTREMFEVFSESVFDLAKHIV